MALAAGIVCSIFLPTTLSAEDGLKIQPLVYQASLKNNEKKRGVIDISNPSGSNVDVTMDVQAFRQIDNQGTLEFYHSDKLSEGTKLDYSEFKLGPRQALRMVFELDAAKLPSGDVFGAIFVSTKPPEGAAAVSVRLGTLLIITNGPSASHQAVIKSVDVPFWQWGDTVSGAYTIANTSSGKDTGFMPQVVIAIDPLHYQSQHDSQLVFAGRERRTGFSVVAPRFGLYKVSVTFDGNRSEQWVFIASTVYAASIVGAVVAVVMGTLWYRRRPSQRKLS